MNVHEKTIWTKKLELSENDKIRTQKAINEEMSYYNKLIDGLNGPQRTMPEVFANLDSELIGLFGELAVSGKPLSSLSLTKLPENIQRFKNIISSMSLKTRVVMEVATKANSIPYNTKKTMAVEILKQFQKQSAFINSKLDSQDRVYHRSFETLVKIDSNNKRNVQVVRQDISIKEESRSLTLNFPFLSSSITVPKPTFFWNIAVIRNTHDGWRLELRKEKSDYLLNLFDSAKKFKKKRKIG